MKKLKDILLEGYAWERKADGSLPTLKDAIATHRTNLSESEKSLSDLEYAVKQHERDNHVYDKTKLTNIYNQLSDIDQKTAKTKFSKYFGSADAVKAKIAKLEKEIADLKHQYYKDSNLSPEREKQLRKQMGEKGRELKRAKREDKTGSAGYGKPSKSGTSEPRWQDSDGDGKWYEPGEDVKEGVDDMASLDEYGDDETHAFGFNATGVETYDAAYDTPKDAMTESFWTRVNGNLLGHDWILENRKNQLNESAVLDNIVIKKKSDSTVRVYNKKTNKTAVYKLEYEVGSSFEPINKMIGGSRFDLTFDEISNKPNLSIEADLPVIKMVNYTIEFDKMQTNKIKQALEKNQNISIKWNMLRIMFTKQ